VSEPLIHPLSVPPPMRGAVRLAAIVPALDEEQRIGATIEAVRSVPGIDLVVVVDDGSADRTAAVARAAGAMVAAHPSTRGKGAAMATGVRMLRHSGVDNHLLVFLDADLGESAVHADQLIAPVVSGAAAMSIAVLPRASGDVGGHGFVLALARDGIRRGTGREMTAPLSGQRCLTSAAFAAAEPLATGWGVEVGLTIDVLRAGMDVVEVDVPFGHRVTGHDLGSQLHRARQWRDVARALAARKIRPGTASLPASVTRPVASVRAKLPGRHT
jgi:glycosyltransferase involved in cell wall biosynthesis